jgi:hypothetical protein
LTIKYQCDNYVVSEVKDIPEPAASGEKPGAVFLLWKEKAGYVYEGAVVGITWDALGSFHARCFKSWDTG